uniref:ABC transporter domain-containing protein n=1 Tax=Romanomermis culicivorax TaxID=13658 RepID=A0A915J9P3_ROMCU
MYVSLPYLLPFIRTGYKRTLKNGDFWRLEKCDESANLTNVFETNWEEEIKTAKKCRRDQPDLHKVISRTFARSYWFLSIFVFCQCLKLNSSALREIEIGKIVNLLSNDVNRFDQPLTNRMKSDHIFVVTAMFDVVRFSMGLFLPRAIKFYAEYKVSVQRIQKFLTLKEQHLQNLQRGGGKSHSNEENQVSVNTFSAKHSGQQVNAIEKISFQLKPGALLMIVGPVGSGKTPKFLYWLMRGSITITLPQPEYPYTDLCYDLKFQSTLLQCLCGDVDVRTSGTIKVNGRTVYLPQKPWVFQGTLRQNVIFGSDDRPFDAAAYSKALEVCSLDKDIENFPKKDKIVIGDRGSALSGGQKARIALARAVYFDADIYLLDDPLAAVDAKVGRFIFEKLAFIIKMRKWILEIEDSNLGYKSFAGKAEAFESYENLAAAGNRLTTILRETEDSPKKICKDSLYDAIEEKSMNTEIPSKSKHSSDKVKDSSHDESVAQGRIKWNVMTAYFGSMGNCITVWSLFLFFFVGQALFNFNDYWLNLW